MILRGGSSGNCVGGFGGKVSCPTSVGSNVVLLFEVAPGSGSFFGEGTTVRCRRFLCTLPEGVSTIYERGLPAWDTTVPSTGPPSVEIQTSVLSGISGKS